MLTARPQIGATHYQLHSGVYHDAFAAERESLDSAVRRLLFWPALRLNRHRVAQLDAEGRLFDPTSTTQFMTFTAAGAERLRAGFSVAAHRIRISHPGVDLARFRALSGNEQPASPGAGLLLLFVGHDFVLKGLKTAIGATARCRQHGIDASLMVAGAGPTRRFRRVATDEGVGNHVFFLGAVDQDALAALYRRSHVLIHPTYYDPFARVVVEAFASGCVVVTTHRCGASEVMNDGVHGRLVERPDDAAAFAAACCSYSGPVAWRETREAGLALANTLSFEAHARSVRNWLAH
jgi:glycosyltransferase involved in cell wall biosynthesis